MVYHIERKSLGEWSDVCYPTTDEKLARDICHMEVRKYSGTLRVATYDDREPDAKVVCMVSGTEWK